MESHADTAERAALALQEIKQSISLSRQLSDHLAVMAAQAQATRAMLEEAIGASRNSSQRHLDRKRSCSSGKDDSAPPPAQRRCTGHSRLGSQVHAIPHASRAEFEAAAQARPRVGVVPSSAADRSSSAESSWRPPASATASALPAAADQDCRQGQLTLLSYSDSGDRIGGSAMPAPAASGSDFLAPQPHTAAQTHLALFHAHQQQPQATVTAPSHSKWNMGRPAAAVDIGGGSGVPHAFVDALSSVSSPHNCGHSDFGVSAAIRADSRQQRPLPCVITIAPIPAVIALLGNPMEPSSPCAVSGRGSMGGSSDPRVDGIHQQVAGATSGGLSVRPGVASSGPGGSGGASAGPAAHGVQAANAAGASIAAAALPQQLGPSPGVNRPRSAVPQSAETADELRYFHTTLQPPQKNDSHNHNRQQKEHHPPRGPVSPSLSSLSSTAALSSECCDATTSRRAVTVMPPPPPPGTAQGAWPDREPCTGHDSASMQSTRALFAGVYGVYATAPVAKAWHDDADGVGRSARWSRGSPSSVKALRAASARGFHAPDCGAASGPGNGGACGGVTTPDSEGQPAPPAEVTVQPQQPDGCPRLPRLNDITLGVARDLGAQLSLPLGDRLGWT